MNSGPKKPVALSSIPRAVTIYDVATHLGVSSTTVWRAVNNQGRISDKTRSHILEEARKLGYRPSMVAQTLARQRTGLLGVVTPMIGNTVYSPMVRAVEQVAFEKSYNTILCDTDLRLDREKAYVEMLIRRRVEGAIVIPFSERSADGYEHIYEMERLGIPVIVMEQDVPGLNLARVVADNRGDARKITQHLIGLGHRRVAFMHHGLPVWDIAGNERLMGYRDALDEVGLSAESVKVGEMVCEEDRSFIPEELLRHLKSPQRPTAMFCCNDMLAIKAIEVMFDIGLRVPEDIAVVGFDDILMAGHIRPSLTTVRQPSTEVGTRAAELLFHRIAERDAGAEGDDLIRERIPGTLVIRKSCGARLGPKT